MVTCYIGIGSNAGNRSRFIESAIGELKGTKGINYKRSSSIYETEPVSDILQGAYLNGVIEIETDLSARALLEELVKIEESLGRVRTVKNAPRTIDLDILLYDNQIISDDKLQIPHPLLHERQYFFPAVIDRSR